MNLNSVLRLFGDAAGEAVRHSNQVFGTSKNTNDSSLLELLLAGTGRANRKSAREIWIFALSGTKTGYSAAAKVGLLWAEDRMKSAIRGTISDRKREPLKTP